jgi:hypothetical protein
MACSANLRVLRASALEFLEPQIAPIARIGPQKSAKGANLKQRMPYRLLHGTKDKWTTDAHRWTQIKATARIPLTLTIDPYRKNASHISLVEISED